MAYPITSHDAAVLAGALGAASPLALVVGAGVSMPLPSGIPAAKSWKTALVESLYAHCELGARSDFDALLGGLSSLGNNEDLKLEAVLEALETALPGVSAAIVKRVAGAGSPNPLHRWIRDHIANGAITCVVTPNFDHLIERARRPPLSSWTTGSPPQVEPILHVHGDALLPDSLRHTLSRFSTSLPAREHEMVRRVLAGNVLCLGWAATDPDILLALGEGSGIISILIANDHPEPETLRAVQQLAVKRPVRLFTGGFDRLHAGGGPAVSFSPAPTKWVEGIRSEIVAIDRGRARRAFVSLTYQYGISHPGDQPAVLRAWKSAGFDSDEELQLYLLSRAEYEQSVGKPGRAALINYRLYRSNRDPYQLSETGDALERTMRGLNPARAFIGLAIHSRVAREYARSGRTPPAWTRARLARAWIRIGRYSTAEHLLTEILTSAEDQPMDLWVRAHCHRLRALARARRHQHAGAMSDIEDALELFRFSNRTLEVGSTYRAAALCVMVAGSPTWRADALTFIDLCARSYASSSDGSAPLLLRLQRFATRLPRAIGLLLLR